MPFHSKTQSKVTLLIKSSFRSVHPQREERPVCIYKSCLWLGFYGISQAWKLRTPAARFLKYTTSSPWPTAAVICQSTAVNWILCIWGHGFHSGSYIGWLSVFYAPAFYYQRASLSPSWPVASGVSTASSRGFSRREDRTALGFMWDGPRWKQGRGDGERGKQETTLIIWRFRGFLWS